jgi:hypothetical protein
VSAKEIRVRSEAEFERLRDRIDLEASHATHHWDLLKGLEASREDYYLEMSVSNTFWHLTCIAQRDAVLSGLCRLYDKHGGALSLGRFILTVKANRDLFSDVAFRERLKDNPYVDTLVNHRAIDDAELDRELASVSGSDPLVSRLWDLRDTVISHTDADRIRRGAPKASQRWLPAQEIEMLLRRAAAITSKYSLLYRASLYGGIAGADDYKSTLRLLRKALSSQEAEIEKGIEQIQRRTPQTDSSSETHERRPPSQPTR